MPITVHEIGPDGQLVQTTIGDEAPVPAAPAPPQEISGTPPDSAPAPDDDASAAPAPPEEISGTPDSAPDVPTSPDPTEEEDDEAPEPLSRNAQRRIDRERRRRTEAEKKQAALEERLRMLEQGYQRPAPEPPPEPAAPPRQEREAYASDEEWIQAQIQQGLAQAREQWQLEQLRSRQDQEKQARDVQWAAREQTFKQQHPDYTSQVDAVLPRLSPQLSYALSDSEMAPELIYHFGHHPDELQRVNGLQPMALVRALGRLEQQLTAPSRPPAPPPTAKPAPPSPLNGAGHVGPRNFTDLSDAEIESMSFAESEALYRRQFPKSR